MKANSPLRNVVTPTDTLIDATAGTVAGRESTIGEMARAYGVTLRTLRFYEDRNLLRPRRAGNARYYGGVDRARLAMILKGKQLGFTLAEIADLIGADGRRAPRPISRSGCGRRRSSTSSTISSASGARSKRRSRC